MILVLQTQPNGRFRHKKLNLWTETIVKQTKESVGE